MVYAKLHLNPASVGFLAVFLIIVISMASIVGCGSSSEATRTDGSVDQPVAVVFQLDCTGSSRGIETGFSAVAHEAVGFAGQVAGSSIKADVIGGNSIADTTWVLDEEFEPDESLVSDRLIQDDIERRVGAVAKEAGPKLLAACQSPDRSRTGSDILGAGIVAANALRDSAGPGITPVYVIASDLRHNVSGDWFNTSSPGSGEDPERISSRLETEGRLPSFPNGTQIVVVGGGRGKGLITAQALKIRRIWTAIFEESGAEVAAWGPDFTTPGA